ncbi:IgGFc-binding protein-like [Sceloporus undulatus]|uniref:IgGFc-binding protein-like n=1 Tax=Sceloporus undulatus TaxID=8520 RepID=UPI001C4AF4AC|nr:IgGFc-binding protein-like [Sceloporus undulatus]
MIVRWIFFLLVGLMLLSGCCARSRGKKFVTAFLLNIWESQPNARFELLITGYRPATTVTVMAKNPSFEKTISVTVGQTVSVELPATLEMLRTDIFNKTVLVQANKDISVFARNSKDYSIGATVVYPVQQLGMVYYVVTPAGDLPNTFKEFAVISYQTPTRVAIHLTGTVAFKGHIYPRGSTLVVNLQAFQAIQIQSSDDLSGSWVESKKPVAVLTGHSCAQKNTACDHVVEQLLPISSWGTTFIVPPLSFQSKYDIAYIVASQSTLLKYQSGLKEDSHNMVAGQVIQLKIQYPEPLYLSANSGIQVLFFFTGATNGNRSYEQLIPLLADAPKESRLYDPFLVNIPDLTDYCRLFHIDGMSQTDNYAVIIANSSETSQFKLAKKAIENIHWRPIPGTEYSWAEYLIGTEMNTLSAEHSTTPFGLLILGGLYRNGYGSVALCSCKSVPGSSAKKPKGSTSTFSPLKPKELLLYPYGTEHGDTRNPKSDDATSPEISTAVPFPFYSKKHHSLYVDNNGVISFGMTVPEFVQTPDPLPLDEGPPLVAPFWGDVYNPISGDVFWRQTQDPKILQRCSAEISHYYPEISFTPTWAFLATWDRVAYFGSKSKKVNTFQVALTTNGDLSFIILNYADIQWTTGTWSNGDAKTGLGGIPAQAGFDNGDKINYYIMPGSRTADILNITKTSNVNYPGRWVFKVDEYVTDSTMDCFL